MPASLLAAPELDTARPPTTRSSATPAFEGMGAIPLTRGVGFRVWAPHADAVSVVGSCNDWNKEAHPLARGAHETWQVRINSDNRAYGRDFSDHTALATDATLEPCDGMPQRIVTGLGPYSLLLLSPDPSPTPSSDTAAGS